MSAQTPNPFGLFRDQRAMETARVVADDTGTLWAQAWAFASIGDKQNLGFTLGEMNARGSAAFTTHLKPNWQEADQPPCLLPRG